MTSIIGWIGFDSRAIASVNLATDSRVSWDKDGKQVWDHAQKTYAPASSAEAFAYCGESLGMTQLISQVVSAIDSGVLAISESGFVENSTLIEWFQSNYASYPIPWPSKSEIVRIQRMGEGMQATYTATVLSCLPDRSWQSEVIELPSESKPFVVRGSGTASLKIWLAKWKRSEVEGTSRSVFSAFCDAVRSGNDPLTGGAPQLVSLRRRGPADRVGWTDGGRFFFCGAEVTPAAMNVAEWRNSEFEECCSTTGKVKIGRQRQPRPRGFSFLDLNERTPPPR